jgi:hypothetical protein
MLFSLPFIRDLLLSSLFNGLFLRSTIQEAIFSRLKTPENPAPFPQPSPKQKSPQYNPPIKALTHYCSHYPPIVKALTHCSLAHEFTIRRENPAEPPPLRTNSSQTQHPSLRSQFITKRVPPSLLRLLSYCQPKSTYPQI